MGLNVSGGAHVCYNPGGWSERTCTPGNEAEYDAWLSIASTTINDHVIPAFKKYLRKDLRMMEKLMELVLPGDLFEDMLGKNRWRLLAVQWGAARGGARQLHVDDDAGGLAFLLLCDMQENGSPGSSKGKEWCMPGLSFVTSLAGGLKLFAWLTEEAHCIAPAWDVLGEDLAFAGYFPRRVADHTAGEVAKREAASSAGST